MLVEAILEGVQDDIVVSANLFMPSPLRDLILHYNKHALTNANLPSITEKTTGSELKKAIGQLDPRDQVSLLYEYCNSTKDLKAPLFYADDRQNKDQQEMKSFFMKLSVGLMVTLAMMFVSIIVFFLYSASTAGTPAQNQQVTKGFIDMLVEIIKFILSSGK